MKIIFEHSLQPAGPSWTVGTCVTLALWGHLGWNSATKKGTNAVPCTLCRGSLSILERRKLVFIQVFFSQGFMRQHRPLPRCAGAADSVSDIVQTPFSRNHTSIQPYFLSPPSKLAAWPVYWLKRADFTTAIIVCPNYYCCGKITPDIIPHWPIRRTLNARKCLLNKHLITLNKTVRESYCRFTAQERKALQGTAKSLLLLI